MSQRTLYERVIEMNGHKFIRLKSGRLLTQLDAARAGEAARTALSTAVSRAFKLAADDYDLERLEWLLDDLDSYVGHVRQEIEKRRGVKLAEDRIALLRNTAGRTPAEAAAFHRKADALEAELRR